MIMPYSIEMLSLWVSVLSGVISHMFVFMHGEWDAYSGHLVACAFLAYISLSLICYFCCTLTWSESLLAATELGLYYLTALSTSIVIYRLFFHRLRQFPGPLGARIWIWDIVVRTWWSGDRQSVVIDQLHAKYGPIVRYAPDRLSINHADAVPLIHGTGSTSQCTKSVVYLNPVNGGSINAERNVANHHARRKIWERALSSRVLPSYIPPLTQLTSTLISRLDALCGRATTANGHVQLFTFDAMGLIGFGRPGGFDGLATGVLDPAITELIDMMGIGVYMMLVPWLHVLLDYVPTMGIIYKPDELFREFARKTLGQYCDVKSTSHMDGKAAMTDGGGFFASPENQFSFQDILSQIHPKPNLKDRRTLSDCVLLSIAGADTTTSSLVHTLYRLARHQHDQTTIHRELTDAGCPDPNNTSEWQGQFSTWIQSAKLPFLEAFIREVLRLHPPAPTGLPRLSPVDGLTIPHGEGQTFIPGNTNVSVPVLSMLRDPRNFGRPLEFLPRRFLPGTHPDAEPNLVRDSRAFIPFLQGPYGCAGKQLAYLEMKIVIAGLVSAFEIVFPQTANVEDIDARVDREWRDYSTVKAAPVEVCFLPRVCQTVKPHIVK